MFRAAVEVVAAVMVVVDVLREAVTLAVRPSLGPLAARPSKLKPVCLAGDFGDTISQSSPGGDPGSSKLAHTALTALASFAPASADATDLAAAMRRDQ